MVAVATRRRQGAPGAWLIVMAALAAADAELAAGLDRLIAHLTDNGRIGYREWLADPPILWRAGQWPGAE